MQTNEILALKNVVKTYHLGETKVEALRGLDLVLKKGEFTALIGKSGSGKSTLLNLVGCIDSPDSGQILFEGKDITHIDEISKSSLRNHKIGFIFQSFNLIPVLNVFENVELPLVIQPEVSAEERKARVMAALKDVELEEFLHYPPDKLSGGQRQRVAIARALVTHPTLVLADEPTANLDSKTSHKIIDLLLDLNQKKQITFLFCSHDEKLIDRVGRIIRIQDGVILE
ncbi:ABC transporter ATP-binding protein [Bdellovibrio sp. HCB337]|uniref:ABC transporter ATP-binding protein n=1 Tax=Bdellovibrio sp. HCB337 TaxID=3394358 RepID=UPI0039A6AB53